MYTVSNRDPLDRARVLAAAVAFADDRGLEPLSMRALAAELGVVPMALYKHVADKNDLVGGMIDLVVAGYVAPGQGLAWRDALRARIAAARASLARHPWLRAAVASRTRPTPIVLAHQNALAGDLIDGGFSVDLAHHALHALGDRIWGFSPEAFTGAPPAALPSAEEVAYLSQHFPHVVAIAQDAGIRSGLGACNDDAEFDFTLDLLLDAFARLHAAGWESAPR
jgi:AcrR family transcriptional regulator